MSVTESNYSVSVLTNRHELDEAKNVIASVFDCADYANELFALPEKFTVFAIRTNDIICSCAMLFESERYAYLYSMCVLPEYRGNGMFRTLCTHISKYGEGRYDRLFLVPADRRLFDTYKKLGYTTELSRRIYSTSGLDALPIGITDGFYEAYRHSVGFIIDRPLLELYFKHSTDKPVKIMRDGVCYGYGVLSDAAVLKAVYRLHGAVDIEFEKETFALSIDYTPTLEKFTDGVYID